MKPCNFIYFNPDELRADTLGAYGDPMVKTPNFDRLASEGALFEQCHVQNTVCTPSRCSFMTGWYPHVRGHRTLWNCLKADDPNTLKYLKRNGWEVYWGGKNDLLSPEAFEDSVTEIYAAELEHVCHTEPVHSEGDPRRLSFLYAPMESPGHDSHLVDQAVDFIRNRKEGSAPFMLYLPLGLPHPPYTVPEPWYSMYDPEKIPPLHPAEHKNKPAFYKLIRDYRKLDKLSMNDLKKIRAVYMGMVSYLDHLLGKLLQALDETGIMENTALFCFSDHGDWAGDYGLVEKWPNAVDDCLTRSPLIIRAPGMKKGQCVKEPVELFDIVSTTLELAGIEEEHTHFAQSLIPQMQGGSGDSERTVYTEGGYDEFEPHCFEDSAINPMDASSIYHPKGRQQQEHPGSVCRTVAARTMKYKFVRRSNGENEFYDLAEDPMELNNLYPEKKDGKIVLEMERNMLDWFIRTSDVIPFDPNPRNMPEGVL